MPKEVWLEWQALWKLDPWGGERGDLGAATVASAVYQAMYGSVNRVIQAIVGGRDEFDYESLPKITDFMPYYKKRHMADGEDDDDGEGDGRPLDPNTMTEEQWARHALEINRWREYQAVRAAHQGAAAPGAVAEADIR